MLPMSCTSPYVAESCVCTWSALDGSRRPRPVHMLLPRLRPKLDLRSPSHPTPADRTRRGPDARACSSAGRGTEERQHPAGAAGGGRGGTRSWRLARARQRGATEARRPGPSLTQASSHARQRASGTERAERGAGGQGARRGGPGSGAGGAGRQGPARLSSRPLQSRLYSCRSTGRPDTGCWPRADGACTVPSPGRYSARRPGLASGGGPPTRVFIKRVMQSPKGLHGPLAISFLHATCCFAQPGL